MGQAMLTPALKSLWIVLAVTVAIDNPVDRLAIGLRRNARRAIGEHLDITRQHQRDGLVDAAIALWQRRLRPLSHGGDRLTPDRAGVGQGLIDVDGASGFSYCCHDSILSLTQGEDCVQSPPGVRCTWRVRFYCCSSCCC